MLFDKLRKPIQQKITYDPQEQKPVIRSSICTGERVGGLKNLKTGASRRSSLSRVRATSRLSARPVAWSLSRRSIKEKKSGLIC